tara:strand:+ start:3059 stop:3454 length:396 start_codon:yes stop_codon:yes gene_type:complete
MKEVFKYFGITMPIFTISYGTFLILWGVSVSIISGSQSITSWIPSFLGAPMFVMGLLSLNIPSGIKIWSHIAVLLGLLAFLGGLDFFRGLFSDGGAFGNPTAAVSKMMLLTTGAVYVFGCIKSFKWAREQR